MTRTLGISIAALAAAVAGFVVVVLVFQDSENVGELLPAILGPFFTVLGTLSGAVAGQAAGAAGTQAAQHQATQATQLAAQTQETANATQAKYHALAETAPPEIIQQARDQNPDAW
jgi:hypothetical protein